MKHLIPAALALSLLGGAAMAQDNRHEGDRQPQGGGGHESHGAPPAARPPAPPARGPDNRGPENRGPDNRGPDNRGPDNRGSENRGPDNRGPDNRGPGPGGGYDRRDAPGGRGQDYRGPAPDRGGFDRDGERGYQDNRGGPGFRGPERGLRQGGFLVDRGWHGGGRFRAPYYRYPSGWGYRYWGFGSFLPEVFLAPDYTIGDYWDYGLPAPPPGYHWIRVGPDALLVRYGDGYVLDAAYGLFY